MLVDKTNFGSVLYNHANFYRFKETSSYWLVFLYFSLVNQLHTSAVTVYNRRVARVREKYLENEIFSRSGKSQGILLMVREIKKGLGKSRKSQGI